MVLPDPDAAAIYQTTNVDVTADPVDAANDTGTGVSGPAQNQLNAIYAAGAINTQLRYGHNYEFRVRMQDLSGGAPDIVRAADQRNRVRYDELPIQEVHLTQPAAHPGNAGIGKRRQHPGEQRQRHGDRRIERSTSQARVSRRGVHRQVQRPGATADRSGEPGPSGRRPRSQPECRAQGRPGHRRSRRRPPRNHRRDRLAETGQARQRVRPRRLRASVHDPTELPGRSAPTTTTKRC